MNHQMKRKSALAQVARVYTLLASLLMLAACDGGIFGTGGPEAMMSPPLTNEGAAVDASTSDTDGAITVPTESPDPDETAGDTTTSASDTAGDADVGTTGGTTEGTTTGSSGVSTDGDATDGSTTDGGAGAPGSGATDGTTGTGTGTTGTEGATAGSPGPESPAVVDPATVGPIHNFGVSAGEEGQFSNSTATFDEPEAQLVVINISALELNVSIPSADSSALLFDSNSIPPNFISDGVPLSTDTSDLAIVNDNTSEVLVSYSTFNVAASTLSVVLVREDDDSIINAVAMETETKTSDPTLAKVRIVRGGTLGDASIQSQVSLQSAGDNPGGVDVSFGPLSFAKPQSAYVEVFAGDYELRDSQSRVGPGSLTLNAGTVYTLLLIGSGETNNAIIINDTTILEPVQ